MPDHKIPAAIRRFIAKGILRLMGCAIVMVALGAVNPAAAERFKSFELKTLDGETRTLEDFRGQAMLVAFFFPSCPYCNKAFPVTVKLYDKYRAQGLTMVWINVVEEEVGQIPGWLAEHRYTVPVLVGASQQYLMRRYGVQMTPEHFLLDPNGEILFKQRGFEAGDEQELEKNIRTALALAP